MKLKLTGLLLLSQSESSLGIDKKNYKQHLCDENSFKPVNIVSETIPEYIMNANKGDIMGYHSQYCTARFHYEEAVERKKTATYLTHMKCGEVRETVSESSKSLLTPAQCIEKQGILYAQSCENLKRDKETMPEAWNSLAPSLVSCGNM